MYFNYDNKVSLLELTAYCFKEARKLTVDEVKQLNKDSFTQLSTDLQITRSIFFHDYLYINPNAINTVHKCNQKLLVLLTNNKLKWITPKYKIIMNNNSAIYIKENDLKKSSFKTFKGI